MGATAYLRETPRHCRFEGKGQGYVILIQRLSSLSSHAGSFQHLPNLASPKSLLGSLVTRQPRRTKTGMQTIQLPKTKCRCRPLRPLSVPLSEARVPRSERTAAARAPISRIKAHRLSQNLVRDQSQNPGRKFRKSIPTKVQRAQTLV